MADPSDKNNQPRREGKDEDEQPKKTPKSGESKREKLVAQRRLEQQQEQRQRREARLRSRSPPPPNLRLVAARALSMARKFLQKAGRSALALHPGERLLLVADKALSCTRQAVRWAVPTHRTMQHEEGVEIRPSPLGLIIGEPIEELLKYIEDTLRKARKYVDLQTPEDKEVVDQLSVYQRELEGLRRARPHTDPSVPGSTAPHTQSTGRFQRSADGAPLTRAAALALTEAAGPSSSAVQRARVTPAPKESSSSSSTSSSASTGSITEEVVGRYYSPPRFSQGWTKREETGDENREKPEQDDERKDSEAQESDEQTASVAEEAAVVFAQAPIPPPAGQGVGEPGAEAGAAGAQGRRRPARVPKPFFFGLLGLKMA